MSFRRCDWLFPPSAREVSPGNRSNYKSTRERVDSKGLYGRWRLHLMGSCALLFLFSFFLFFCHPSCRKDQFTVLILKFGQHWRCYCDPGLLKIPLTLSSLSSWFCLHKYPGYWAAWGRNFIAQSWVINIMYSARLSSMIVRNRWKISTSSPPNKDGKIVHFGFCAVSFMIWVGWGGGGGGFDV